MIETFPRIRRMPVDPVVVVPVTPVLPAPGLTQPTNFNQHTKFSQHDLLIRISVTIRSFVQDAFSDDPSLVRCLSIKGLIVCSPRFP